MNDEHVERVLAETRPTNDQLYGEDFFCAWTSELAPRSVVDVEDLRLFRNSDLCRCCNLVLKDGFGKT